MTIETEAAEIGRDHGKNAASWVFEGHSRDDQCEYIIRGIDTGDPAVYDAYRTPDLSGEYAGDYTPRDLASDLGIDDTEDPEAFWLPEAENAYLDAAYTAFWEAIEREARDCVAYYVANPD